MSSSALGQSEDQSGHAERNSDRGYRLGSLAGRLAGGHARPQAISTSRPTGFGRRLGNLTEAIPRLRRGPPRTPGNSALDSVRLRTRGILAQRAPYRAYGDPADVCGGSDHVTSLLGCFGIVISWLRLLCATSELASSTQDVAVNGTWYCRTVWNSRGKKAKLGTTFFGAACPATPERP